MKELTIMNNPDHLMGFAVAVVVFIILLGVGKVIDCIVKHFADKN